MALIPVELPWTKTEVLEGTTRRRAARRRAHRGPRRRRRLRQPPRRRPSTSRSSARAASSPSAPPRAKARRSCGGRRRSSSTASPGSSSPRRASTSARAFGAATTTASRGEHPPLEEIAASARRGVPPRGRRGAGRSSARRCRIDAALHLFEQEGETLKVRLLRVWPSNRVPLVSCLGFTDVRHGPYAALRPLLPELPRRAVRRRGCSSSSTARRGDAAPARAGGERPLQRLHRDEALERADRRRNGPRPERPLPR